MLIQSKGSSLGPFGGPGLKSCLLAPPGSPKHYSISQPPAPEFAKALMGKTAPNPGLPSLDVHPARDAGLVVLHSPTHSLEANVERGGGVGRLGTNWPNSFIDTLVMNTHISSHTFHLRFPGLSVL